eukprot:6391666-Amphidinium_carterae.1
MHESSCLVGRTGFTLCAGIGGQTSRETTVGDSQIRTSVKSKIDLGLLYFLETVLHIQYFAAPEVEPQARQAALDEPVLVVLAKKFYTLPHASTARDSVPKGSTPEFLVCLV